MAHIRQKFQQVSECAVSMNIIRKEVQLLGFHGRAAVFKPFITKSNSTAWLRWYNTCQLWTVQQWKRVFWSDESRFSLYRFDGSS